MKNAQVENEQVQHMISSSSDLEKNTNTASTGIFYGSTSSSSGLETKNKNTVINFREAKIESKEHGIDGDDMTYTNIQTDEILDQLPLITRVNSLTCMQAFEIEEYQDREEAQRGKRSISDLSHKSYLLNAESDPHLSEEFLKIIQLVSPVVMTYILEYLPGLTCIVLVGHIDSPDTKQYVDAATLSTMFTNVTSLAIGFGLSSALDTLCSQAYGAGRPFKNGIYLQSGMVVIGICLMPIFFMNWHAEQFLLMMGQDPQVSHIAGQFSRCTVIGIPFLLFYEMNRKLLQAQKIVKPLVWIAAIGDGMNILLGFFLTYYTQMGFYGAAWSRTIGYMLMLLLLLSYYYFFPSSFQTWWSGWNWKEAKAHIKLFLQLGIPGMLMMMMQWWAYEMMALMAGLLPNGVIAVSAHAVLMNVSSLVFMFFLGISVTGNIRVGNALGANQPKKARMISHLTLCIVFFLACLISFCIYFLRHEIPKILINDPIAIEHASIALVVLVPYVMVDAMNCVIQGIFRGVGRQNIAAKINFFAFYIVGLPLSALLAFNTSFGVEGLWMGFGVGILISMCTSLVFLSHSSWEKMAQEAFKRITH